MQLTNTTLKHINKTEISPSFPSFLTHNLPITPAIQGDSIDNHDPAGVGYAPIVRQPTTKINSKPVPIERERQKIVEKNYPLFIPGIEEQCDESKNVLGAYRCNDCHKIELKVAHCEEWTCRVCGARKVRRQAKDIVKRLYAFKRALGTSANPRHFVISSKKWESEKYDLTKITRAMNHIFAKYLPDISGVYVVHPFRIRGWDNVKSAGSKARFESDANIKRRLREYRNDKETEINSDKPIDEDIGLNGFWDMVKADVLELGSWRKYCYVSPHVHIVGWGKLPNAEDFYEMTGGEKCGLIYKMIDTNGVGRSFDFTQNSGSFDFSSEVLRTLNYLGSHSAIRCDESLIEVSGQGNRKHANRIFRPFGLCSTKAFKLDSIDGHKYVLDGDEVKIQIKCPECSGLDLVETAKFNRSHFIEADSQKPFDDDYNPLDFEGDIITDLIKPLRFFEWSWYRYKFNHVYLGDVERFAKSLPKLKPYRLSENYSKMGILEKLVCIGLADYDKAKLKNTNDGVMIE